MSCLFTWLATLRWMHWLQIANNAPNLQISRANLYSDEVQQNIKYLLCPLCTAQWAPAWWWVRGTILSPNKQLLLCLASDWPLSVTWPHTALWLVQVCTPRGPPHFRPTAVSIDRETSGVTFMDVSWEDPGQCPDTRSVDILRNTTWVFSLTLIERTSLKILRLRKLLD